MSRPSTTTTANQPSGSDQTLAKWERLLESDPARAVRALRLTDDDARSAEGDSPLDMYAVLTLLSKESAGGAERADGTREPTPRWLALVDAGVADALCKCALAIQPLLRLKEDTPAEMVERMKAEMRSPYHIPLEILCLAATNFDAKPSEQDKTVIAALREHWHAIMTRLWENPENSLRTEPVHNAERIVVAQLAARVVQTDITFSQVIFDKADLTIPVIARHWASSTTAGDCYANGAFLVSMVFDPDPSTPVKPDPAAVLQAFYRGINPTANTDEVRAKSAAVVAALHLNRLTGQEGVMELELCCLIHELSTAISTSPAHSEFSRALRRSEPFWRNSTKIVMQTIKECESEKKVSVEAMRASGCVIGLGASLIHMLQKGDENDNIIMDEKEAVLKVWCKEGFFDFLDEVMDSLLEIIGMTQQLARMFSCLDGFLEKCRDEELKKSFRAQFPRWKSLGTLVQFDLENQKAAMDSGKLDLEKLRTSIPDPEDHTWVMIAWQMLARVQAQALESDATVCTRRGCGKQRAGIICGKCKVPDYCSTECQTLDAQDGHKAMCDASLMDIVLGASKPPSVSKIDLTTPVIILLLVLAFLGLRHYNYL